MSTTAIIIITDALKEIRVIGESEVPTADQASDMLRMLNRMLEVMSIDEAFSAVNNSASLTLTGTQTFTIGPTGTIVDDRPVAITEANYTLTGVTYPVRVLDYKLYDLVPLKTITGSIPQAIYMDGTFPNATVYCYPLVTGGTLLMRTTALVKSFATLTTQIDLPIGYEEFITLSLSIRAAPGYNRTVNPDTRIAARTAMNKILRNNGTIPTQQLPVEVMGFRNMSKAQFLGGF